MKNLNNKLNNNLNNKLDNIKYNNMQVIKRNGQPEKVSFDKIITRINKIAKKLNLTRTNPVKIAQETVQGIYNNIHTEDLDFLASQKCAEKIIDDPQYDLLAAGICVSNLHKSTTDDFMIVTEKLYNNKNNLGEHKPLVSKEYYDFVKLNIDKINKTIDYSRDYKLNFFSIKTLERSYLMRIKGEQVNHQNQNISQQEKVLLEKYGKIVERPQHTWMRLSLGIHLDNIDRALISYNSISNLEFIHGSPAIYNSGTNKPQMSSCFLLYMGDSIEEIFNTITNSAYISKWAGGVGINISNIRAKGSMISGTNGICDGIVPLARHLNTLARYINQGGRRNGAIAIYMEPWHPDIFDFCTLKTRDGNENLKARDLFLGLWIPDLFMKCVMNDDYWYLMCPNECPNLAKCYGDEFESLYYKYVNEQKYRKKIKARELWQSIMDSQIETGIPYMLYKDHANRKSNQQNLGTIGCSNLCSEIIEYTDNNNIAVCNLSSICLPRFITTDSDGNNSFDFNKLYEVSRIVTRNLDNVIDYNYYPVPEAKNSNLKHRPIGIGVQGLADVFCILEIPFDSKDAIDLNTKIFETIYFGAVTESNHLAIEKGKYESFEGSPASKGLLQFHLWGKTTDDLLMDWDWDSLISSIKKYGLRNSLLTAIMPTASTSQIMCNQECIEPYTRNLYLRSTLAGEYVVVNKYLIEKLISLNLWTDDIKNEFIFDKGSIQSIDEIPLHIKNVFKTAFEMKTKPILDHAISRAPFICQSQSMNIFMDNPNYARLASSHFYAWKNGLKTGMYYLRSQPASDPLQFGIDHDIITKIKLKRGLISPTSKFNRVNNHNNNNIDNNDPRRINEITNNDFDSNRLSRLKTFENACDEFCGA